MVHGERLVVLGGAQRHHEPDELEEDEVAANA